MVEFLLPGNDIKIRCCVSDVTDEVDLFLCSCLTRYSFHCYHISQAVFLIADVRFISMVLVVILLGLSQDVDVISPLNSLLLLHIIQSSGMKM